MSVETQLMTAAEFEAYIADPANADRHLELINGEVVEDMPTEEHSIAAGNLYFHLRRFVDDKGLGRVVFEVRRKSPDDDHNVMIPDVDFTSSTHLKDREDVVSKGPVTQMPDLAIEVQSPGQSLKLMSDKAALYLAHGSRMVWLGYPSKRLVEVLTADDRALYGETETLDGGTLLPGFSMPVADIFKA